MTVAEIIRLRQTAVPMKKNIYLAMSLALYATCFAFAQEIPRPTTSSEESATVTPTASASAAATSAATRSIALRFVPPPMEGTISLGIFDSNGKLVRVLHREAKIDNLQIEENSLSTTWDGKNDTGENLSPGKYRARGYLVGKMKVDHLEKLQTMPTDVADHISVRLVTNPLTSDTRAVMDVAVATDARGCYFVTIDGLPLATFSPLANAPSVSLEKHDEKSVDVWLGDEGNIEHLRVSNIDKMMAFDCGFFELK